MSNITWGIAVAELANAVGASFRHNQEEGFIEWTKGTAPTKEEIDAEIIRLQADYDAKEYQRKRESEYPPWGDQLDDIYHNGITEWKKTIKAVKDKYPKP